MVDGQLESDLTWENIASAVESAPKYMAEHREDQCISLRDVAALAGVPHMVLFRFERGASTSTPNLVKILRYLGAHADDAD